MSRSAFDLPPLELLVAFDAAARHLSFTLAADEVALTQSAVSRQIQNLEESLGVALFRRLHRALALTDAGRQLHAATAEALGRLDRTTRDLKQVGRARNVVVTTTPGFAGLWLIPRLAGFVAAHPGVDVRISAGNSVADLERDGVDVAVRYRAIDSVEPPGTVLFGETVSPVCSPRLTRLARRPLRTPPDLRGHTLLRMEPDHGPQLHDWDLWLHALGLSELRPQAVLHFSSYDQLVSAAVAGQGVALGRLPLIDRLLASRQLVLPFADAVVSPRAYSLIVGASARSRPEVAAFAAWLEATARAPDSTRRAGRGRA
ncbi:MAG: LysR substrate-binding domain-containing protein [Pseudomonadota bacterium]|nr:LysR substrate-binding domain-containing protein [Pseudomonadota bacterium]